MNGRFSAPHQPAVGELRSGDGAVWDGTRWVAQPVSPTARALTERLFVLARAGEFYTAACRVDEVLEEVRAQAYEDGRAAARRERAA